MFTNPKDTTDKRLYNRKVWIIWSDTVIETIDLNLYYGDFHAIHGVCIKIPRQKLQLSSAHPAAVKARCFECFNRMNDLIENTKVDGQILIEGEDILDPAADLIELRKKVGMVFQRPNVFNLSIYDNLAFWAAYPRDAEQKRPH